MKKLALLFVMAFAQIAIATAAETSTYTNPPTCPRPLNLAASNTTGTSADLSWDAVVGAVSYTVVVENGTGNNNPFSFTTSVTSASYTVTGLTPALNYKFKVRATCADGKKSSWSAWKQFNSSNALPCTTPTGLASSSSVPGEATLTWGAVGGAQSYIIKVEEGSGNNNNFNLLDTVATNSLTVSGLVPGLNYKFKVRSHCFGGNNTGWSGWFVFTTPVSLGTPVSGGYYIEPADERDASDIFSAKVSPNPITASTATLLVTGAEGQKVQAQLFDMTGKMVFATEIQPEHNGWHQTLSLPVLPAGLYFLKTQMGAQTHTAKVVIGG